MKRLLNLVWAIALTSACVQLPQRPPSTTPTKPTATPTPIVSTLAFDLVACSSAVADNFCVGPANAQFKIHLTTNPDTYKTVTSDGNGYVYVTGIPSTLGPTDIEISATNFVTRVIGTTTAALTGNNHAGNHNFFVLQSEHADPTKFSLDELAAIKGAMWPLGTASTCGALPHGPRPYAADNVIATDFFNNYSVAEQDCIIVELKSRGYTHVVVGPLVDSDGYHGIWNPNDWRGANWDKFLDIIQKFYDANLKVVVFGKPDNWKLQQFKNEFDALLSLPRSQKLIRIFVVMGWEPKRYADSSCTFAEAGKWAHRVLPNALILLHMEADQDAPAGGDELCNDDDKTWNPGGNAAAWGRVSPYFHGVLFQFGAFDSPLQTGCDKGRPELTRFQCFVNSFDPNYVGSYRDRFEHRRAGWPDTSLWGDRALYVYAGEYSAYWKFWAHRTEAEAVIWGDAAIKAGAFGCLDSCSVLVPVRR